MLCLFFEKQRSENVLCIPASASTALYYVFVAVNKKIVSFGDKHLVYCSVGWKSSPKETLKRDTLE